MVVFFGSTAGFAPDVPAVPTGPDTYAAMPVCTTSAGLTRTGRVLTPISTSNRTTCITTVTITVDLLWVGSVSAVPVAKMKPFILRETASSLPDELTPKLDASSVSGWSPSSLFAPH
jgi:hypothetical protein